MIKGSWFQRRSKTTPERSLESVNREHPCHHALIPKVSQPFPLHKLEIANRQRIEDLHLKRTDIQVQNSFMSNTDIVNSN